MSDSYRNHNELVNKVLLYLHSNYTGRYWTNNTGAVKTASGHFQKYGLIGSTDILGFSGNGTFVAIEVKTGSGKLSKQQIIFKEIAELNGCIHITIKDEINPISFKQLQKKE